MTLNVVNDDGTISSHQIVKENFYEQTLERTVGYIATSSKEQNSLNIFKAYFSNAKAILFDETNQGIVKLLEEFSIEEFNKKHKTQNIFDLHDFSFLFFTSGTTGTPIAALKSKKHLESEVQVLSKLLNKYQIKQVIVTVPFVHLYGMLLGLLYPLLNDIDIVFKEHFLPHDLLDMIEENSMIVTTPLYIKALNKLNESKDLKKSVFISSTAPLDTQSSELFHNKFNTNILQIFGSTETGGIAYKLNQEALWTPFEKVIISTNNNEELHVQSPFVSNTLYENGFKQINGQIQTFDYIEKEAIKFRLIGRSSKIFKIAGKRYSTVQIETILEDFEEIVQALVFVKLSTDSLRGEYLDITLESTREFTVKEIKSILRKKLSNLKFSMEVKRVASIPTNLVGKKLKV